MTEKTTQQPLGVASDLNAELGCGVLTMNLIIACVLLACLFSFIFVISRLKEQIKNKNEIIDGLLKITDEQKQEIYNLRYLHYAKNEAEISKKYTIECDENQALNMIRHKGINYDPIAQLVGLTQRQGYARQAAMQQAAIQGQYGLNNSIYGLFNKT
ncbi:hypothetical protein [Agitococcus lubricus]|nr:hypothetical protein [Agitococcus lubricus]